MLYELEGIKRNFKGRTVLDIDRLGIKEGKIYSLIGPNGAGKTTLLNLLAFLDKQSEGVMRFKGALVGSSARQMVEMRRSAVLVDQYPILFTGPVWKNLEYGLKIRKVAKGERRERVREVLDLVGMQRFLDADAHKLSGGETKRLALARALAFRPEVLLCDEPGANVDKENQEIILSILDRINKSWGTSIIFSTHYLSQGRSLADETLMLEHGCLSDMVNENIFRATITHENESEYLCHLRDQVSLAVPRSSFPEKKDFFKIYLDPEKVERIEVGKGRRAKNTFSGHVIHVNQDRGRIRIGLDIGIKLFYFEQMARYLENPPHIGRKVTVHIPDGAIRYSNI